MQENTKILLKNTDTNIQPEQFINTADYCTEIDTITESSWSDLLCQFTDASLYHTWHYASAIYGKGKLSHLILKNNGKVVAIAQVGIKYFPYLYAATANIHWGPLWRKKNESIDYRHFTQILNALKEEYAIKRRLLLRIWPNETDNDGNVIEKIIMDNNFIHNPTERPYRTLILDITPPVDILRKNLDQKWRNQLNKAEKNNLTITKGGSDELYNVFLKLQKEMISRKSFIPGVDYETYRSIQHNLPDTLKMNIFVCKYDGTPLAVSMCSAIGETGIYMLGATGDNGMKLNGSNLLQWKIIEWLKENGCRYYDLGGIDPNENPGVYRFKCGVAGKTGRDIQYLGQFFYYKHWRAFLLNILLCKTKSTRKLLTSFKAKYKNTSIS